jgi:hypothetical protein
MRSRLILKEKREDLEEDDDEKNRLPIVRRFSSFG